MADLVHHLARRGLEVVQQHRNDPEPTFKIPAWGAALLGMTTVVFFAASMMIRYTYAELIGTLTMIETPTATAIVRTSPDSSDPDAPHPKASESEKETLLEQELLIVKTQPITAKFRTTIAHLRAHGGFFSRFRGAHLLALYYMIYYLLCSAWFELVPQTLGFRAAVTVGISTLLCRLNATWTHVVISEPSDKRMFQRIPARSSFGKLAGPTFLNALAKQMVGLGLLELITLFGLQQYASDPSRLNELNDAQRLTVWAHSFLVLISGVLAAVFIIIPSHVALKRVQASLLPEEDESIVPFDRTFNGKVVPEILGGSGRVGMREAWKSFDWNGRIRLVKVYTKVLAMQMALFMVFVIAVTGELRIILGDRLDKVIMQQVL
ncbi:hypothetical protein MMC13_006132 [Lambiella insularis]|nr:hypothetical protein [Lambiella insularis]